jgi:hypothetical protein
MDAFTEWLSEVFSPANLRRNTVRVYRDLANWCDIRCTTPLAVLAGLNCVAWMIVLKAQWESATFQLSDARMGVAALGATALIVFSRWLLMICERAEPAFWIKVMLALVSLVPFAALFIIATPRNSGVAVSVVGLLGIFAANANLLLKSWIAFDRLPFQEALAGNRVAPLPLHAPAPVRGENLPLATPRPLPAGGEQSATVTAPQEDEPQEWNERSEDQAGQIVIEGEAVARFEAGWSLASVHIPFQPPFEQVPEFQCEIEEGSGVHLRPPAVFRYGARLELKRSQGVDEAWEMTIPYQAVLEARTNRAA